MKSNGDEIEWLKRAESNFKRAKAGKVARGVYYEDLCYDCQQAAEKALKAIFIFYKCNFPQTHNIKYLLQLLNEQKITVPIILGKAENLSNYASTTRYPGDYDPVDGKEYKQALKHAANVLKWATSIIKKKPNELF